MNHAKLEASRHTVFLIPVCTGGLRTPDRGSGAVRLRRKVADTASRSWGAPQRQGASDGLDSLVTLVRAEVQRARAVHGGRPPSAVSGRAADIVG